MQTNVWRSEADTIGSSWSSRPRGLRVRAERSLSPTGDVRTVAGLASCEGDRTAYTVRLCTLCTGVVGYSLPAGEEDSLGARQSQHSRRSELVRDIFAPRGKAHL